MGLRELKAGFARVHRTPETPHMVLERLLQ